MAELTAKERKFVDAVSKGVGHRDAALAAGYSARSAHTLASRLLNKVEIKTALQERQEYFRSIANVEGAEVIGAQKEMAFASIEDALDDKGYLDFKKAKETGAAKLIKKISRQQTKYGETVAVEFYSRSEALAQLADILGLKKQPSTNPADAVQLARKVVEELLNQGKDKDAAVKFAAERYDVLEAELIGV